MNFSLAPIPRAIALAGVLLLQPGAALAQPEEKPPTFSAAQIPGITRVGPNYTIENQVLSNGLQRVYFVKTPYGEFTVQGDAMLQMRLVELLALSQLEKVSNSESFARAMAQAGLDPLKFTGRVIANPLGTVKETFSGVGAMLGRIQSGVANAGKTQDKPLASALGVTSEKRELAAHHGVDPYTDFPPLKAKLDQLARAAALGGLTVTGALVAVPGAAGIVVSNISTANKLNNIAVEELARKYTAAQILDQNRALLAKMRVDPNLSASLLANPNYTPIDLAVMLAALDSMPVQGREIFVARAAAAPSRAIAYFTRRQAEMLADGNRRNRNFVRFVDLAGYPFLLTREGRIVAVAPIDALSWTEETAAGFGAITAARQQAAPKARGELRITGQATALAKRQLKAQGWTVRERQQN